MTCLGVNQLCSVRVTQLLRSLRIVTLFAADADGLLLASGFVIFHLHYHSGRIEAGLL